MILDCGGKRLDLSRPAVMGILNVTPDSFSDGGRFNLLDAAVEHALDMVEQGATIIDVGGESTRPGAAAVSTQEECDRVLPVIEALVRELAVPVSIDTSKAMVMTAAAQAGAGMINDVLALQGEGALAAAASAALPVCLMHMQGSPRTMQNSPRYEDVTADVATFLRNRREAAIAAGIPEEKILLDPGFGFGKTADHNYQLMRELPQLAQICPLLVGVSRKSMIASVLDVPAGGRVNGSVALALMAAERGAKLLRVHDVKPTVEALRLFEAVQHGLST